MEVLTETFVQRHKVIYTGMWNKQIVYNNPLRSSLLHAPHTSFPESSLPLVLPTVNTKGIHTVSDLWGYLGRQGDKENRLEKC